MELVRGDEIPGLVQRTLNKVDPRLVDHGKRVGWLVAHMADAEGGYTAKERQDLCILAMLHDVGAYKTEEIDQMVRFETERVWGHAIYGYLFIRNLSPLKALAPAVLYHHLDYKDFGRMDVQCAKEAQMIYLADRVDILLQTSDMTREDILGWLDQMSGFRFDPAVVALFRRADREYGLLRRAGTGALEDVLGCLALSAEEIDTYLKMLIYTIDFRSQFTVTHTVTTTRIAARTAELLGIGGETARAVYYGAVLHDLGKVAIPVEILEFPGKLSAQAMNIMRTHVELTEEILGGAVDETTTRIAVRHHEKLDGSGYPRGLSGEELTLPERIVAVADIVSALGGTRSYKESFPKKKTLEILSRMSADGLLDPLVVDTVVSHFDEIMKYVQTYCGPVLHTYESMNEEYQRLMEKFEAE